MRRRSADRTIRSRFARTGLLVCAVALGALALACGKDESATPEPAAAPAETPQTAPAPGAVPPAAGAPEQSGEEGGDATVAEGVIPDSFPSDVPLYPGATVGASMTTPGLGVFATFETDDPVDAILAHYRGELAKGGWSVTDTAEGDGVDGSKGNRSVQVRARKGDDNRTEIVINATTG
jgi:hypothetical protein